MLGECTVCGHCVVGVRVIAELGHPVSNFWFAETVNNLAGRGDGAHVGIFVGIQFCRRFFDDVTGVCGDGGAPV